MIRLSLFAFIFAVAVIALIIAIVAWCWKDLHRNDAKVSLALALLKRQRCLLEELRKQGKKRG